MTLSPPRRYLELGRDSSTLLNYLRGVVGRREQWPKVREALINQSNTRRIPAGRTNKLHSAKHRIGMQLRGRETGRWTMSHNSEATSL